MVYVHFNCSLHVLVSFWSAQAILATNLYRDSVRAGWFFQFHRSVAFLGICFCIYLFFHCIWSSEPARGNSATISCEGSIRARPAFYLPNYPRETPRKHPGLSCSLHLALSGSAVFVFVLSVFVFIRDETLNQSSAGQITREKLLGNTRVCVLLLLAPLYPTITPSVWVSRICTCTWRICIYIAVQNLSVGKSL